MRRVRSLTNDDDDDVVRLNYSMQKVKTFGSEENLFKNW